MYSQLTTLLVLFLHVSFCFAQSNERILRIHPPESYPRDKEITYSLSVVAKKNGKKTYLFERFNRQDSIITFLLPASDGSEDSDLVNIKFSASGSANSVLLSDDTILLEGDTTHYHLKSLPSRLNFDNKLPQGERKDHALFVKAIRKYPEKYEFTHSIAIFTLNDTVNPFKVKEFKPRIGEVEFQFYEWRRTPYLDTLRIAYSITNEHGSLLVSECQHVLNNDTSYVEFTTPVVDYHDDFWAKQRKFHREASRNQFVEDFGDALGLFEEPFVYGGLNLGHRPSGEVLASMAIFDVADRIFKGAALMVSGPTLGAEFNFRWNEHFVMGPKFGFNISTFLVNAGLHGIYFTNFKGLGGWYLQPRVGINPLTPLINISYSYNIALHENDLRGSVNRHQLSIFFALPLNGY